MDRRSNRIAEGTRRKFRKYRGKPEMELGGTEIELIINQEQTSGNGKNQLGTGTWELGGNRIE